MLPVEFPRDALKDTMERSTQALCERFNSSLHPCFRGEGGDVSGERGDCMGMTSRWTLSNLLCGGSLIDVSCSPCLGALRFKWDCIHHL